ncbi:Inner membrane transport permease ybhR [uncultured Clostridium sp.]|uniref:ABC transporter permease n=1 Tax=uncultured Clostridium sp. TaxID=59620 RepID=UPI00082313ED|nr:ABC transporter permease [uncultured Clostridium sp.]SCK03012.1 Inner membrane transport permease ybhR [uncultured Clostridium sp.]
MNIITIAVKEFIQSIRDKKNFLLMIFMPTILILILSSVLDNDTRVKKEITNISINFINGKDEFAFLDIDMIEDELRSQGFIVNYKLEEEINEKDKNIFIEKDKGSEINIYYDSSMRLESLIVENIIMSFSNNLNHIEIEKSNSVYTKFNNNYSFKRSFAINTYAISMITLTILFASVTGAYSLIKERNNGTLKKLLTLSISTKDIIIGKFLGALIISIIQIFIVIIISNSLFEISFGGNKLIIVLVLAAESSLAISFGAIVGSFINDNKSCWIILLTIIMTLGLLGGSFIPLNKMNSNILIYLSSLSPITYINNSIFNSIFLNDNLLAQKVIVIFLSLTIIFLMVTIALLGGENENINSCI